jgi:long-subunit acyl-CoA synthetase (AMP-forming)
MENGAIMKQGLTGEISVRGPNIATGYWANPKATAEAFSPDGFFKT